MPLRHFHPTIQSWFRAELGDPSEPQLQGWPKIRAGDHSLIAAPTGSGKTLAAFLNALDSLLSQGKELAEGLQVLYLSPLKALGNDVQKNLQLPLAQLRELDPELPDIRVAVRSGDTSPKDREAMRKRAPHILVTTPESLYILLSSAGGQAMLSSVRTVIVDEIHALARDKRGSHLSLSLERLEAIAPGYQRIGLSATQKPIEDIARFLVGEERNCEIVDCGHLRELDLRIEVPQSPLSVVCSDETWEQIYSRMAELIEDHRTTLVFANTRKMTERIAARLTDQLGEDKVASHHGSLSKERRLDAEQRLKAGELRALVATASLELGIDVGEVDLVIQVATPATIAILLQRVGRAGHGKDRIPKGRLFPLTIDELVCSAALLLAIRRRDLDRIVMPDAPLDILAQQIVAALVQQDWSEDELFERLRRATPYKDLRREDFDALLELHAKGRSALIHRDQVRARLRATRRARLPALTAGGAIPDRADYRVLLEPEGTYIGSVDEDFAVESSIGDIFQLGNTSWRVLKVEPGKLRVADAKGVPPSLPFWFGEAPARSVELSAALSEIRETGHDQEWLREETDLDEGGSRQIADYLAAGKKALGAIPSQQRMIIERFPDESGGSQLVLHAPFGGRINRALGLALRKRFCRGFGFELQAAANEEAVVLSLGPMHSFPLMEVFDYLHPNTVEKVLSQALLASPMFETRWRWNVSRSLVVPRTQGARRLPAPILRMRADDALADAFPEVRACGETLPPGDLPIPMEHPIVRQTIHDCLHEAMDLEGLIQVLHGLRDGSIEKVAIDSSEPSAFALGILNAQPYAFLDDAPLEERRTQAVMSRHALDSKTADEIGALDPAAVERVKQEAWPDPRDAEELHESLLWMGFLASDEVDRVWRPWLDELKKQGRVELVDERWYATEASRDPKEVLRGRMEALGPVFSDDPLFLELEAEGCVLRARLEEKEAWCNRRLLARIHRYTVDRLRAEIEPVSAADFMRFLALWQHADPGEKNHGLTGLAEVIRQLSGVEVPAHAWESEVLPARVEGYRRDWLDQLTLSGEVAWGRIWGRGASAVRNTPLCLLPRADLAAWSSLRGEVEEPELGASAGKLYEILQEKGALFPTDLEQASGLLPSFFEQGMGELVARGLATCDSFAALRQLIVAPSKRRANGLPFGVGRWSLLPDAGDAASEIDFVLDRLLGRYGVIFSRLLMREKQPIPWRDLLRRCRERELRGDLRGGRFVARFSGEQYALPEAIPMLRKVRRRNEKLNLQLSAADPLNLQGILTPDGRVSPMHNRKVDIG
ncbi:MAG: DEAD/DEAH box helicase [Planctomycetota bacterium]